ncbi:IS1634 family transposase [Moorella sp. Hama-1]|uniref:IS1634 family transposase n=1 Tax=Moorella sp. Hama-1 TaxID=2138101 RepID=UPI000D65A726|nr:IS1634 family transposase [Moorella sp. Hama-1]
MYIRIVQRKNKDGSVVRYVQLAHNFRDPETRKPQAQVLWSFGREEEIDKDSLRRLVDSINRFLGPEDVLQQQAKVGDAPLLFKESRPLGGAWVLDALWCELGIDRAIGKVIKDRAFRTPVERAIFAMAANRALDPQSKLAVETWVERDVAIPGLESIAVQQLYRAMDVLMEAGDALQEEVFFSVAHLLNLEVDLLFFDTTSTYFEVEGEDPEEGDAAYFLRRRGHSKDHRPDLAQIVIGLAVTREGIPIRCWVWPGNTADVTRIDQVKKDLVGWKLGRVITVLDRGFVSEDNLRTLQRAGGHYIAGERMQSGKPSVEEALSRPGRYQKVKDNVEVKEIIVGDGEARKRYILVRNPYEEARDREQRERMLKELEQELQGLARLDKKEHGKAVCRLVSHPTYGRYLKLDKRGWPQIDRAKVKADERLDGKYLLRTSDDTLSPADVALGYKQLLEVEAAFRTLKQALELRPIYHRLSRRIEAHVLLCWLALLLIRVAETRVEGRLGQRYTWPRLRDELNRMHLGIFAGPAGTVWQRTETTTFQRQILSALGVEEPPRFFKLDPRQAM